MTSMIWFSGITSHAGHLCSTRTVSTVSLATEDCFDFQNCHTTITGSPEAPPPISFHDSFLDIVGLQLDNQLPFQVPKTVMVVLCPEDAELRGQTAI